LLPAEIQIPKPEFNHPAELAMLASLLSEGANLVNRYIQKETKEGITYIARDAAKRIFPEYEQDRINNNRYADAAASALADAARRTLMDAPARLPRNIFLIVTGAPASGKTVAFKTASTPTLEIVNETIITSRWKAERTIGQALDAGRRPLLHLIYTNDPRINVRRMIARSRRIGRTVPLEYMANAYIEVPKIALYLSGKFSPQLQLKVTDNSGAQDSPDTHDDILRAVRETSAYNLSRCLRCMDEELDKINEVDPILEEILREAKRR
jgi:hypothetical protein